MSNRVDVMISSTARDLPAHRAAAEKACKALGMFPIMMEDLPALDADAIAASLAMVQKCEVYVLVVAHRYGYMPKEGNPKNISVTQMEYEEAIRLNKPRLVFLVADDHTPPFLTEADETAEALEKLHLFKRQLNVDRVRAQFRSVDNLEAELLKALQPYRPTDVFYEPPPLPPKEELAERGDLPAGSTPLLPNADFQGRKPELLALADTLLYQANGSVVVSGVTGAGGMGKTQLAKEFALRYGRFFYGVHWLNALGDLGLEIAARGGDAEMKLANFPENDLPKQIQMTLDAWHKQPHRLVILDNLDTPDLLKEWLPKFGKVRLLITSRRGVWASHWNLHQHALDVLPIEDCRALLRRLASHVEKSADSDLDAVSERLGCLPLAVFLAGRYIDKLKCSPTDYLQALAKKSHTIQDSSMTKKIEHYPEYEQDLMSAWLLSWERITTDEAKKLFGCCGLCAPNRPIPRTLLARALQTDPETDPDLDSLEKLADGLSKLFDWGLLTQDSAGNPTIHPLLADFARSQTQSEELLPLVAAGMARESQLAIDTGLPAQFTPLLGHIELVAEQAETAQVNDAATLWGNWGYHLRMLEDSYNEKKAFERAFNLVNNKINFTSAVHINNLGMSLLDTGDLIGAKIHIEHALQIWQEQLNSGHPQIAIGLNNLGLVLQRIGDLEGAKTHFERALQIDERAYGSFHPKVAIRLGNLGLLLKELNQLSKAKICLERALFINEMFYGVDHPEVAIDVDSLGSLAYYMGDLVGAKSYFERALKINEAVYGENLKVARNINDLGLVAYDLNDFRGAKSYFERALRIFKQFLLPTHSNIQNVLYSLTMVKLALGEE